MKICFVTVSFGAHFGGSEVSAKLLMDNLEKRGHEIHVLTTRTRKELHKSNVILIPYSHYIPRKMLILGNSFIDHFLGINIKNILKNEFFDVIHVQDTFLLPATLIAAKNMGIPIIATERNNVSKAVYDLIASFPISSLLKFRNKIIIRSLKKVDAIISNSEHIKNELIEACIEEDKITTIYVDGITPDWKCTNTKDKSNKIILFAPGRIYKYKGFGVLINAIKLVIREYNNIKLVIAGEGPYKREIVKLIDKLNLNNYIELLGKVSFEKIKKFYFKSDIVIFPPVHPEPFGRISIEAMTACKPVIASNVGGIPEAVEDGVNGILVPPNDPKKLDEAIIRLIEDESLREAMGKYGRKIVNEKFNRDRIVDKQIELYSKVTKIVDI